MKNIAFLTSGIMDYLSSDAWNGIKNAARNDDVNLITVPLKYIARDLNGLPDRYEYQYEVTASFLKKESIDGLIVAADYIGCLTTREVLEDFIRSLDDIPMVLMASRIKGYPGVTFDNVTGIKEALSYLIEKKGIRNIGMIGGPDWNNDAHERRLAYEECLREHGIEIKDNWYIEGDLTEQVIAEAGELLDMAPELQAIFCVNDSTAIGLYDVMRCRGLEPGSDICVFGFDNLVSGAMMNPSLSTIDANTTELAGYAYKMLMRMLCGEEVGEEKIPTRFICRDSFGNASDAVDRGGDQLISKLFLDHYFDQVFYRYRNHEMEDGSQLRLRFIEVMSEMIDITRRIDVDDAGIRRLTDKIKSFLKNGALDYTDYDELIPYMQRVHSEVTKCFTDDMRKKRASEVLAVLYKYIIKIQNNRNVKYKEHLDHILYSMKTLVRDSLNFSYANDLSYVELVSHLDWMDIRNAYVYIFEKPIVRLQQELVDTSIPIRLKATLKNGVPESVPFNRQPVTCEELFNNAEMGDEKKELVMMPLYFGDTVYGLILHDLTEMTFRNGEFLTNQLGTAARMIEVLRVNNEVQKQLEDSIAVMRQHNIELDKLSRNDVLTGILNRRGFNETAEEIITENKQAGRDTLISYVDMNNLKIINDRFGHEEGDFSLQTISSILMDVVGDNGIVGRIGGDEYAFVYSGILQGKEIADRIKATFEEFNKNSVKPYNISVSCGFCLVAGADKEMTLEEAMSIADRDLYIAKQSKDNRIIKNRNGRKIS